MEIEMKYAVESPAQLAKVWAWPGWEALEVQDRQTLHMQTQYWDTPAGDLARLHWTLRRRQENDRSVICLKTPMGSAWGMARRGEWEVEGQDIAAALPHLIAKGAPPELARQCAAGLQLVCGAVFIRQTRLLGLDNGTVCEVAADQGRFWGGGREQPFAELEIELKSGDAATMVALCHSVANAFHLRRQPLSKVARARQLAGQ